MDGILEVLFGLIPDIKGILGQHATPYATYQNYAKLNVKVQTQLAVALALGSFCILLFSFLRLRLPGIYESRERFFSALLFSISFVFVFLLRSCEHRSIEAIFNKEQSPRTSSSWYTVTGAYIFSFLSFYFFKREFKLYRRLRWTSLKASGSRVTSRTVRITNIPPSLRGPALERYLKGLNLGQVEKITFWYTTEVLERYIKLRTAALFKVERSVNAWLRGAHQSCNMDVIRHSIESGTLLELEGTTRPTTNLGWLGLLGPKVDTISYNYNLFLRYSAEVERIRNTLETLKPRGLAFVTFKTQQSSHFISQLLFNPKVAKFKIDLAPEPLDIYWKNLNFSRVGLFFRRLAALLILIFTIFFGVLVIYLFFQQLVLKNLQGSIPSKDVKLSPESSTLPLQDLILLLATTIFFSTTPFIFTGTSVLQGLRTHCAIEKRTISLHFLFLFFNILLVLTLVATFWDSALKRVLEKKVEIVQVFAEAMEENRAFFTRYFILLGIGCFPLQLLHPGPLFYYILCWVFCSSPRGANNLSAPVFMDYGWLYGTPIFVFVVVSIYSSTSPGILAVGVVYFVVGYFVVKNNLLYVYTRHYESHGLLWPFVYRHLLTGIVLSQLFIMGKCIQAKANSQSLAVVVLILMSIWFFVDMRRRFPNDCRHLPADWFFEETSPRRVPRPPSRGSPRGLGGRVVQAAGGFFCFLKRELLPPNYNSSLFVAPDPCLSEPDLRRCTCQPTSLILKGILDSSITSYRCPYVYGELPHLWLPPQATDCSPYLRRIPSCPCCLNLTDSGIECLHTNPSLLGSSSAASLEANLA